ncbi:MAG TPA: cobalamin-binding protein [Chromatiales bacterium]|nr:cobalamin-binding protein [Chromatiales bacterium]
MKGAAWLVLLVAALLPAVQAEGLCVEQADGGTLCLDKPAQRIVSLAPHLTEMLFAIGAQAQIAAVVDRSDHPPEALKLQSVGSYHKPDLERMVSLRPDLVVAWKSGSPAAVVEPLRALGLQVLVTRGENLDDIPRELRALGRLTGHEEAAEGAAMAFEGELDTLRKAHEGKPVVSGFFEIWPHPLITVSDAHFIGQAMQVCGIRNIVGNTAQLTPTWSEEAVIRARPELLLISPPARQFERWRRWKELPAVRNDLLVIMPPNVLMRPGPRLIEGVRALCDAADLARAVQP